jgi:hypothetical protein
MVLAIWQVKLDNRDSNHFRRRLTDGGFISANYFSANGFDLRKMRKLACAGKLDAVRCIVGNRVKWYYAEQQAELARLKGEVS